MNRARAKDSLNRCKYAAEAIEAVTLPDTVDELGGEMIHNAIHIILRQMHQELDQLAQELKAAEGDSNTPGSKTQ